MHKLYNALISLHSKFQLYLDKFKTEQRAVRNAVKSVGINPNQPGVYKIQRNAN